MLSKAASIESAPKLASPWSLAQVFLRLWELATATGDAQIRRLTSPMRALTSIVGEEEAHVWKEIIFVHCDWIREERREWILEQPSPRYLRQKFDAEELAAPKVASSVHPSRITNGFVDYSSAAPTPPPAIGPRAVGIRARQDPVEQKRWIPALPEEVRLREELVQVNERIPELLYEMELLEEQHSTPETRKQIKGLRIQIQLLLRREEELERRLQK